MINFKVGSNTIIVRFGVESIGPMYITLGIHPKAKISLTFV